MKRLLLAIYAIAVSTAIITLLYFASPYVTEYPKVTTFILALAMLTSVGTGVRSILEMGILWPMAKIAYGIGKPLFVCLFIFFAAMLVAVALPWLNGVSGFNVWCWISSIAFTLFNFETFYAFVNATLRMYKFDYETK